MMSDDNENAQTDFSDRHIRVDSAVGEVVVRDDRADLSELEETADALLDRAEELYDEHVNETDSDGVFK